MEIYVHFPFCKQKCRYCDFASYIGMEDQIQAYTDVLLKEALLYQKEVKEEIETVYFGGGTPSLIPPQILSSFIKEMKEIFTLKKNIEWTVEANPGTLTEEWLNTAREGGINRLSLGMQSSEDRLLKLIGRIHSHEDTVRSVDQAREAGFENLNLDLIFGLPTQSRTDWETTLNSALALQPEHISAYGLIPEENTPLWNDINSGVLKLPDVEAERDMYDILLKKMDQNAFNQYEISNFAKKGYACKHNIGYWTQTSYLGLGLSAASMVKLMQDTTGIRYYRRTNTRHMNLYMQGIWEAKPVLEESGWIMPKESRFETMMLGLRMNKGIAEKDFKRMHTVSLEKSFGEKLNQLRKQGLLCREEHTWKLTRKGMDLQNMVLVELMDD